MAAGDILSVEIGSEGWYADVETEGLGVGGTYDFGFTAYIEGSITTGTFQAGETITQTGTGATATMASGASTRLFSQTVNLRILRVSITGTANATGVWTGNNSGATFTPTRVPTFLDDPLDSIPKFVLTVTSKGYTTGVLGTRERSVWGKKRVRVPTGTTKVAGSYTSGTFVESESVTQATSGATGIVVIGASVGPHLFIRAIVGTPDAGNDWTGDTSGATFSPTGTPVLHGTAAAPGPREFFDGTNTTIRIALSHYVYVKDKAGAGNSGTDPTYSILSGLYTSGTASNAGSGTATNSSVAPYQKAILSWAWTPFRRNGSTDKVRVTAWHGEAEVGGSIAKPGIDRVTISRTDGSATLTQHVDVLAIDSAPGFSGADESPVQEFFTQFDNSGFSQGADLTDRFIGYPLIGDTTEVYDSSTTTLLPVELYRNQTHLCDRTGAYGQTLALVDSATGVDPGAADATKVYDSAVFDPGTAYKFATIGRALASIAAYNNANRGRNDIGGGIVKCNAGNYTWLGTTNTYGSTAKTWATIEPADGVDRTAAVITGVLNNGGVTGSRIRIHNMRITASVNTVFTMPQIWFDKCEWESTANSPIANGPSVVWMTHNKIIALVQGLKAGNPAHNVALALVRGNLLAGFAHTIQCYTVIGNARLTKYAPTTGLFVDRITGQTSPIGTPIIAFNRIFGWNSPNQLIGTFFSQDVDTSGFVYACNVSEDTGANTGGHIFCGAATLSDGRKTENVIMWHNVMVGARVSLGYNDQGSVVNYRHYWSVKGNYWDITGIKTDTFLPGGGERNGNRIGNWPVVWGVGFSANISGNVDEVGPVGFDFEHPGISSIETTSANDPDYPMFVDRKSYDGSDGAGGGDYNTLEGSPLRDLGVELVFPNDLQERDRTTENNDTGVFAHAIAPAITDQPDSANKSEGESVTFTVVATGIPEPTYQWRKDGVAIPGETGSSLTINNLQASDAGDYDVVVTNDAGSVTSDVAVLTVQGTVSTGCDVQTLLTDGKCFYGLSPASLEVVKVQLWCNIGQNLP